MFELLLAFSLWPWVLFLFLVGAFSWSAYYETVSVALISLFVFFVGAFFLYDTNPFSWIYNNPGSTFLIGGFYAGIGALWSLYKWKLRLTSKRVQDDMAEAKGKYMLSYPDADPKGYMDHYTFPHSAKASENKSKITTWIGLWPFSMIGYFLGELLMDLFNKIYDMLSGLYDKMTKHYAP